MALIKPVHIVDVPFSHLGKCVLACKDNQLACLIITRSMFRRLQKEAESHGSTAEKMLEMMKVAGFIISDRFRERNLKKCVADIMRDCVDKLEPYIMLCKEG